MSDTTDDMEYYGGMMEAHFEIAERNLEDGNWTMKNGQYINVKDMETSHINNCLAMLTRNSLEELAENGAVDDFTLNWIKVFEKELKRRKAL